MRSGDWFRVPGLTRAARLRRRVAVWWWSRSFRRHCRAAGTGLEVQGPCVLLTDGDLTVGNGLTVRSRPYNRVELAVASGGTLRIGDGVFINQGARIACTRDVRIGDDCLIADECVILDTDYHATAGAVTKVAPVVIGNRVWLATRVIVLRGVTIGEGSVVGAGSVVTKSIPPYSFAAGMPARVIKSLKPE